MVQWRGQGSSSYIAERGL
ncbi:unnamed protein product [Medioppia subpectinata]|uniref:Uncharacterized protein n=1 Tax=Medioppia subpectinata TaxID=1979941 RepID=A0A7R9QNM9_9ACAR|nr:unnamed protein product [Medioppia subpectinata]CAG2123175.1 unnamed protein product [Medioppia subpectinata]